MIEVAEKDKPAIENLLTALNDDEDVVAVYTSANL